MCKTWRRLVVAVAAASALAGGGALAAGTPGVVVQDPHYGDVLFHFYQEHYFSSLTTLMVSQQFERVPHHADETEVLRGGLLLSYGMHREAAEVFAQLIDRGAEPRVRDRAWFYLAKIRYQRGLIDEALEAVNRVEDHLPPALEEERGLLTANLLLARGDAPGAARVLEAMTSRTGASLYARYNLGVALVRSGQTERGSALLDEVGQTPAPTEEYRSLRDKANVALGYAALRDEKPERARAVLMRVRLAGLESNKALLGFGEAADQLNDAKLALVPWTELAAREVNDAAVMEAKLAVPRAFGELGAYAQSLSAYQEAIAAYEGETTGLDESIAAIRGGRLVADLAERNPGVEMGWFFSLSQVPQMPHAAHLSRVMAEHDFQEAFKNWRDLQFLSHNLADWSDKLGVFDDMLANRRRAYEERLPQVQVKARSLSVEALQQRRDGLAGELSQAEADADGLAFADARERALMARLEGVREALRQPDAEIDLEAAQDKLRRLQGALVWQLAQQHPLRLWDAQKALKATDAGLAEAHERDAALAQAQRDEPARQARFAQRIAELDQRIRALTPRVAALSREQQGELQEIAVAELARQKERLAAYAEQARFAVAQIYDRAVSRNDVHAPKP